MTIALKEIPADTLTPFMWVEFGERDNYDSLSTSIRGLLIGKSTTTVNNLKVIKILTPEEAKNKYGEDSELHKMAEYFFKNSTGHSVHCIGLGASNTLTEALDLIGDEVFQVVASPINEDDSLGKAVVFFEDRFKAMNMLGGTYLTTVQGTVSQLTTKGDAYNSKNLCLVESGNNNDASKVIGALVGNIVQSGSSDPAIPFQFLELKGIEPRAPEKRLTQIERQQLLKAGVGTIKEGNTVTIETIATTYKRSANNTPDKRWSLLNKVLLASYIRADLTNHFTAKYGRSKLGEDGRNYAPGQKIMTPSVAKSELIAKLREYEYRGFIENVDGLVDKIRVEKEGNILKFSAEVDLMDQLKIVMGRILI